MRPGSSPPEEVAVPGRVLEVAVADRTGAERQVRQPQVEGTQRKLELPAVEWLGQFIEGGRAVAGHALGIAGHEPVDARASAAMSEADQPGGAGGSATKVTRPRSPAPGAAGSAAACPAR